MPISKPQALSKLIQARPNVDLIQNQKMQPRQKACHMVAISISFSSRGKREWGAGRSCRYVGLARDPLRPATYWAAFRTREARVRYAFAIAGDGGNPLVRL